MVRTSPIQFLTGTPFSSGQRKPTSKTDCLLSTKVHSRWPSSRFSRGTPARQRATRHAGRQASSDVAWAPGGLSLASVLGFLAHPGGPRETETTQMTRHSC
jgi:hypothetical protein